MAHIESDGACTAPWWELGEAPSAAGEARGGLWRPLSPHTCNPVPAHRCQVARSAQEPSKYHTDTQNGVEEAFW